MKEKKENIDKDLKKEYERFNKNLGLDKDINSDFKKQVNELYFSNSSSNGQGNPLSVNNLMKDDFSGAKWNNAGRLAMSLKPEEALRIAIERTVESGAPINNVSFYDEINLYVTQMGHLPKAPIDIKEALKGLINVTP